MSLHSFFPFSSHFASFVSAVDCSVVRTSQMLSVSL